MRPTDSQARGLAEIGAVGGGQKVIPEAGLPFLEKYSGQSHWNSLKTWYRQQGIIID